MALKLRRGLSANLEGQIFAEGELIYTTDTKLIYVGDGSTPGNELTPLGTGGGSSPGINDTAGSPVLTLTNSSATLGVNTTINGDLIIGDYEITGTFDLTTEGRITVTGDAPFGQITAREFSDGTAQIVGGVFTGDVVGNVTGNVTGNVDGNITTNNVTVDGTVISFSSTGKTSLTATAPDASPELKLTRTSTSDISADGGVNGEIKFSRTDDINGSRQTGLIRAYENFFLFATYPFTSDYIMKLEDGKLAVGDVTPSEKLHVVGNALITGDLTASAIKGTIVADDSSIIVDGQTGEVNIANTNIGEFAVSNPQTGQVLKWNGTQWANAADSGGGSGSGGLSAISIGADDSSLRIVEAGESFLILGGTGITTTSDVEGNITITASFDGTFAGLTGTPTTLAGYGITDAITASDFGAFSLVGSIIDTTDSSAITMTPAVVMSSDLTVENSLTVTNKITAATIEVDNLITTAAGTPELASDTDILLTAGTRVEVTQSPFKLASFTDAERDALSAENGDMIYNTTNNRPEMYVNGAWKIIDTSPIV